MHPSLAAKSPKSLSATTHLGKHAVGARRQERPQLGHANLQRVASPRSAQSRAKDGSAAQSPGPVRLGLPCTAMGSSWRVHHRNYGFRPGATNGLASGERLFFSKQVSSRSSAAMLLSSGTEMVEPSPLISKTFAFLIISTRVESVSAMVTASRSAETRVDHRREPIAKSTGYCLPRSNFHFDELRTSVRPSDVRRIVALMSLFVVRPMEHPSNLFPFMTTSIRHGPIVRDE